MTRGAAMLHRLANGLEASASVVIVTAHPDDETIGLGGVLSLLQAAQIVQITDGAPEDAAHRLPPHRDDRAAYAAHRRQERATAFAAAGWNIPVIECGVPDQQGHAYLEPLIDRLFFLLSVARVVITHAYEGGHPDHDAAAYAVQAACDRLTTAGNRAPDRLEFASYHWNGARRVHGRFWPDARCQEWTVPVSGDRLDRKRLAIAAFTSQVAMLRKFPVDQERYRVAPRYDFTQPPPTPACLYERKGWPMTNADLRAAIARIA